jgi:Fe-S cluster biogenesis protein NfuA
VADGVAHLETLIEDLERTLDPAARARVQEIVGLLLDVHADGLTRLLERLVRDSGTSALLEAARDEAVAGVLLLHGLHPLDLETRVRSALESVKPALASHGGNVELVGLDDRGVVRLRLEGSCHGCPSSAATLRSTIERAIHEAAPDVAALVVEGAVP